MFDLFLDWISLPVNYVSNDIIAIFAFVASSLILMFLLDFLRFIMYYLTRGR